MISLPSSKLPSAKTGIKYDCKWPIKIKYALTTWYWAYFPTKMSTTSRFECVWCVFAQDGRLLRKELQTFYSDKTWQLWIVSKMTKGMYLSPMTYFVLIALHNLLKRFAEILYLVTYYLYLNIFIFFQDYIWLVPSLMPIGNISTCWHVNKFVLSREFGRVCENCNLWLMKFT